MIVKGSDEGTNWYECVKCKKACDPASTLRERDDTCDVCGTQMTGDCRGMSPSLDGPRKFHPACSPIRFLELRDVLGDYFSKGKSKERANALMLYSIAKVEIRRLKRRVNQLMERVNIAENRTAYDHNDFESEI